MTLTRKQLSALVKLRDGGKSNPYKLGVSVGTLEALRKIGMVSDDRSQAGRVFWDITDAGREFMGERE